MEYLAGSFEYSAHMHELEVTLRLFGRDNECRYNNPLAVALVKQGALSYACISFPFLYTDKNELHEDERELKISFGTDKYYSAGQMVECPCIMFSVDQSYTFRNLDAIRTAAQKILSDLLSQAHMMRRTQAALDSVKDVF